ncbi:autophagy regulatory protein Atg2, putative [Talaromyces stipitatus ATCC 10500]|uniref:Autophagy-related protein 2 n=1 Tax=Talaromyces stipitatus (strain ATCC 10500 / CBS 375.48 / QM 6759 / NRRL 1006) TaxID=441959 RepID=B8MAH1_TALSN|nr:autophagy regulatory protein Atg2, putative [Talaromyces stipitatus ATCC 10500]EED17395.1 autophagy regulatory protein Atg2, putative [Talaromyces stipitatus ATCC 10500]
MDYFLPSFVQKRLLRYALSRLELVDTEAIDLDSLGIRWGHRSTFELHDLGLKLDKLSSILQLPATCKLLKARASLIRVTIPADIHSSGIITEVEGVDVHVQLLNDNESGIDASPPAESHATDDGSDKRSALPTTNDLAQSFIESEPREERAEIEAAIASQSQYLQRSTSSLSDEDEVGLGNEEVLLPSFISGFLQGILDRLQIKVMNVIVRVDMDLPQDGPVKRVPAEKPDQLTASLVVGELSIGCVASLEGQNVPSTAAGRTITLDSICVQLMSDPIVFSNYSRFAATPPSPSTTTSNGGHGLETVRSVSPLQSPPITESLGPDISQSIMLYRSQVLERPLTPVAATRQSMESSTDSLDGRFSDADSEAGHLYQNPSHSLSGSQFDGFGEEILDNPGYLDEVFHSQFVDDPADSTGLPPRSPQGSGTPRPQSPQIASSQVIETWHDFDEPHTGNQHPENFEDTRFYGPWERSGEFQSSPEKSPSSSPGQTEQTQQLYYADLPISSSPPDNDAKSHSSRSSSYSGSLPAELSESKIFSHEEASSMYMSAVSGTSSHGEPLMPGAWDSRDFESLTEEKQSFIQSVTRTTEADIPTPKIGAQPSPPITDNDDTPQTPTRESYQPDSEPRSSPSIKTHTDDAEATRKIIDISNVTIWIPKTFDRSQQGPHSQQEGHEHSISMTQSISSDVLGGSRIDYSTMRRSSITSSISTDTNEQSSNRGAEVFEPLRFANSSAAISINIGRAIVQFDVATGWLLVKASQKVITALNVEALESKTAKSNPKQPSSDSKHFKFSLHSCSIRFLESLGGVPYYAKKKAPESSHATLTPAEDVILQVQLSSVNSDYLVTGGTTKFQLEVTKFVLGYATESLISFNKDLKMRESIRDVRTAVPRDVSLTVVKTSAFTKLNFATLPLHINFNIQKLDNIFGWLGGLSTLMELGNSIASVSTVRGDQSDTMKKQTRGVRFEGVPTPKSPPEPTTSPPWKINARLGGVILDVVGETCAVKLKTTAVKAVSRYEGIGIQIDKAKVVGPCLVDDDAEHPVTLGIGNIRVEYLYSPKEVDLDRLLSLLTPSKDKYEEDDDIMLDTLFRQRRQGGVLRVAVATAKLSISDVEGLKPLSDLPHEISRLSSVTKYLPEDDRPGIMTLVLVREFESYIHVNEKIGDLRLLAKDTELAHISIPSLIAAQVKDISLTRNETEGLIGEALNVTTSESSSLSSLPMLMVRFIADEMDPTIKVKLHGLRVEYTLPSIIAFLGLGHDTTPDELAVKMASSVANLADLTTSQIGGLSFGDYGGSEPDSNPFKLAVSLRDCVVGLNPRDMPAKGLAVFTYAKFKCINQDKGISEANFEIRKATLMIIDDVQMVGTGDNISRRTIVDSQNEQVNKFADMGFVPVSYISSTILSVTIQSPDAAGDKTMDVELRDDLLILETCADSTQTLISLLNGLAPPSLPSTTLKYRTEVMPLQDMLSSFTGDAFMTDQVINAEEVSAREAEDDFEGALDDEVDYVSDFYPQGTSSEETMSGSMTDPMADMSRSRQLMDSFHSQYNVSTSVTGLDFKDDHFARKSTVGGTAHRWDTAHNTYGLANEVKLHGSPLRVRVRDVHFIWNLFDGYDWQRTRDTISKAVKDVELKAAERRAKVASRLSPEDDEEESVIGDFLFNSIYIGIPANKDPRELARAINHDIDDMASETGSYITSTTITGYTSHQNRPASARGKRLRLSRSKHHKMTFELKGISADFVVFPPNAGETQSTIDIRVNDLEIFDHIPTSTWKKFATYMNDAGERESGTSMVHLEIINVKPVAELAASEIVLKATVLPLRLHVDQDALDFLSRFFEFKDESAPAPSSPGDTPFLQRVEVNAVRVKLDFKPKRVDYAGLRSGRTTEFMNFFILDEADMVMRHVIIYGVSGFERLGQTLNDIWMPDIKRNQLPGVLAGLAPIRSLVNVGSGVKDLVVIPMREYKKDGRIVRSIQKGAFSFAKTTTNELIKLGAKLAIGTQTVLQSAEDFLNAPNTGAPHTDGDGDSTDEDEKKQISHYADQPVGVVQGLRGAFRSLERDLLMTRDAIVAVPGEVMESSSAAGAAKAVWRRAPTVILRPAIGATRAVGQTLLGAGNSLDPTNRRKIEDKYKRH